MKTRVLVDARQELPPVHHRHHQIEQDQAWGSAARSQQLEGFRAIARPGGGEPLSFEDFSEGRANVLLVVDHEHVDHFGTIHRLDRTNELGPTHVPVFPLFDTTLYSPVLKQTLRRM